MDDVTSTTSSSGSVLDDATTIITVLDDGADNNDVFEIKYVVLVGARPSWKNASLEGDFLFCGLLL